MQKISKISKVKMNLKINRSKNDFQNFKKEQN